MRGATAYPGNLYYGSDCAARLALVDTIEAVVNMDDDTTFHCALKRSGVLGLVQAGWQPGQPGVDRVRRQQHPAGAELCGILEQR